MVGEPQDTDVAQRDPADSPSPNDEFFKQTFQSVEHATALLRSGLPAAVSQRIAWHTLEQVPTEHIDEWFNKRYSDVLFRAQLVGHAGPVYIDVMLEHQSTSQRMMVLRMLGMLVRRYEALLRQEPTLDRLPVVLPVVLYQGDTTGRPWQHARRLREVLAADEATLAALAPFIPDFEFSLDDLTQQSIDHLHQRSLTSLGYATLRLLRDSRQNPNLLQELDHPREIAVWRSIASGPNGRLDLVRYLLYIYRTSDASRHNIRTFARKLGQIGEDADMTAAERLIAAAAPKLIARGRAEGRSEGEAKGRSKGLAESLRQLLTLKFGSIDQETHSRIDAGSLDELARWVGRILSAQSIDDVFAV